MRPMALLSATRAINLNCPVPVESMDNQREAPKRENQAAEGTLATQLVQDGHDALRPLRHVLWAMCSMPLG